jgi:hypothetical protein
MPRRTNTRPPSVQNEAAARARCTDLTIDVSVQDGDRVANLPLQQVRANLRKVFEGKRVVVVGNSWHPRAIIIPLGPAGWLSESEKKARNARLKKQVEFAVKAIGE